MIRSIALTVTLVAFSTQLCIPSITAADGGSEKATGCSNHCCEPCMLVCRAETKLVKEKKHGWEVKCEHICIPSVQCPLFNFFGRRTACSAGSNSCQDCGDAECNGQRCFSGACNQHGSCGRIRTVRKLNKEEYEVEKCVVEWSVKKCAGSSGKCCDACAPANCCSPCQ